MHRNDLLQKLEAYAARWPDEQSVVQHLSDFVETHADCFERGLAIGHITGSVWLVNQAGTHVLLTHHRKLDMWLQLGGHADGDSNIARAALREAQEESGLHHIAFVENEIFDIDIHPIPEHRETPAHDHFDVRFSMRTTGSEEYSISNESHDLKWVDIQQLEEYTNEPSMLRMAGKWLAR